MNLTNSNSSYRNTSNNSNRHKTIKRRRRKTKKLSNNNKLKRNLDYYKNVETRYKIKHKEVIKLNKIINKSKKNLLKLKSKYDDMELNNLQLIQDNNECQKELKRKQNYINKLDNLNTEIIKIIKTLPNKTKKKFDKLYNFKNNSFLL